MILGFGALVYVPLEQFKAMHFLSPIIVVLLSFIIFREKIYRFRIFALIIGFLGMLIIVRPGYVDFNIGTIMILVSLTFWSFIIILSKNNKTIPVNPIKTPRDFGRDSFSSFKKKCAKRDPLKGVVLIKIAAK